MRDLKAVDLHDHLRSVGSWVDWESTVDGFKAGDPQTQIKGIAVAWMSLVSALYDAYEAGCNLFVTHEPTFYVHRDDDPAEFQYLHARQKRSFLESTGMVVYRCHDVWDVMPQVGIVDTWGSGLDLGGSIVAAEKYYAVFERPETTVASLAQHVAGRVRELGQESVQVVGNLDRAIRRVGVGTGAITDVKRMARMGAEALIVTDDGIRFWQGGSWALDAGLPLIVVNHATAEEWGMQALSRYIANQFVEVPVRHIPQGCMYQSVS